MDLHTIIQKVDNMANELKNLQDAVAAENTVIDSAEVLLKGLKDALDAAIASGNPAAIQAVSDSIGAKSAELSAAVVANTPSQP
jgi:uncharacterized protein YaaN involved in tellurite resistance